MDDFRQDRAQGLIPRRDPSVGKQGRGHSKRKSAQAFLQKVAMFVDDWCRSLRKNEGDGRKMDERSCLGQSLTFKLARAMPQAFRRYAARFLARRMTALQ